ncbi:hypothetical protein BASA50_006324 [Batrachochytrium salamandrivorans]|uniref:Rap-GAP domain-containing protein n=1 Tax=Batrachochytrium salamandrivorans TaxID=1357716 RepID=A0ABQ8FAF7_9FUNG|nr:hypothetical protein BASA50_006324 [Batrachochytrium salamandrivorans]
MFAARLSELGMLEPNPESGILDSFPLSVKRKLISEITQCLLPRTSPMGDPGANLSSAAHVNWMMEVVGQGFSLPIDDVIVIQDSINVYHSWLLEKTTRPAIIQQHGDSSDLAQHFFQPTSIPAKTPTIDDCIDDTIAHIELCKKVLSILLAASKALGQSFTAETWVILVKVLLGISDILLAQPISTRLLPSTTPNAFTPNNIKAPKANGTLSSDDQEPYYSDSIMGDRLCEPLIRTLLEVWLISGLSSVEMWDRLKKYFVTWTHRIEVIHHWSAVIFGLTKNVVKHISVRDEESQQVVIVWQNGHSILIELSNEFLVYSWHRIIYVISDPCKLSARNFQVAITGLSKLISLLNSVDAQSPSSVNGKYICRRIDGNTILNMFGEWIFQAANMDEIGFEDGRAEALGILCRVFSNYQQSEKFLRIYLEHFCSTLNLGLRADILSLTSIILNSGDLFIMELEGIRALAPVFVMSLYYVLPLIDSTKAIPVLPSSVSPETLRRSAYKIIGSIIPLCNRFQNIKLHLSHMNTCVMSQTPYFSSALSTMIWMAYQNKDEDQLCSPAPTTTHGVAMFSSLRPHILNLLMNSLAMDMNPNNTRYVIHLIACFVIEDSEYSPKTVNIVLRVIQDKLLMADHWPNVVVMSVIDCLNQFAALWEHVFQEEKATEVCICRAYDTLVRWAILGDWLEEDFETQRVILSILARGVALLDRDKEFSQVSGSSSIVYGAVGPSILSASSLAVSTHGLSLSYGLSRETLAGGNMGSMSNGDRLVATPSGNAMGNAQAFFNSGGQTPTGTFTKKTNASIRASGSHTTKLFKLQRTSQLHGAPAGVSTGSKDGGVGLPTFATLSAEIRLKNAAEAAISSLMNHLSNFPPKSSCMGITQLGSIWDELREVQRMSQRQSQCLKTALPEFEGMFLPDKRFIRYYSYENRLILGFIERPVWALAKPITPTTSNDDQKSSTGNLIDVNNASISSLNNDYDQAPAIAMVIRDSTGKYGWWNKFKYEDLSADNPEHSISNIVEQYTSPAFIKNESSIHTGYLQTSLTTGSPLRETVTDVDAMLHKGLLVGDASTTLGSNFPRHPQQSLPPQYPYAPLNSIVVQVNVFNEDSIPLLSELCVSLEDIAKHEEIRKSVAKQKESEMNQRTELLDSHEYSKSVAVSPPPIVDRLNPANIPQAFRIFLADFGMLDLQNQSKIAPLQMSESLIRDLEKLDRQPERDCITISVLYCHSGSVSSEQIIFPESINDSFGEFLWSLGWPIDIKLHTGFKGSLTPNICDTAPYYANGNLEAIFHCPYLYRTSVTAGSTLFWQKPAQADSETMSGTPNRSCGPAFGGIPFDKAHNHAPSSISLISSMSSTRSSLRIHNSVSSKNEGSFSGPPPMPTCISSLFSNRHRLHTIGSADNIFHKSMSPHSNENSEPDESLVSSAHDDYPVAPRGRARSHTVGMAPYSAQSKFVTLCQQILQNDNVYIIWIEDTNDIPAVTVTLAHMAMVLIFVNPLPLTEGLFLIRISMSGGLSEDTLNFGPLADGMVVSRQALGMLCRSTAFAAYRYCHFSKNVYKRPTLLRRQLIEEICNKSKAQTGGFFADLFSQ